MINQKKSKQPGMETEPLIPAHVLRFMNAVPMTADTMAWIIEFKEALRQFLGDVDRIGLFINANCSLLQEQDNRLGVMASEFFSKNLPVNEAILASDVRRQKSILENYWEHLRQAGFPFNEYQPPQIFTYSMFSEGSHLGMIWLFRIRGGAPISIHTIELIQQLRPFITFVLSHWVTWNIYVQPESTRFYRIVTELMNELRLTPREREVISLRLFGFQKKAIANKLFLSEETISKHVRSILRKGKARTFIELFMRYYLPDLETMTVPSPTVKRSSRKGAKSAAKESPAREQNNLLIW